MFGRMIDTSSVTPSPWRAALAAGMVLAAACGRGPDLVPAPVVDPGLHAAVLGGPVAMNDSAADEVALEEIRELEFRNLAKGGGHVRGVVAAPSVSELDLLVPRSGPAGGGASGATYDLDVESFVSNRRVQYYMDFFLGHSRDRFTIWLGRLRRYEGMIRNYFRMYELPEDLVYLALIESGYSNTAVSRARAVGMWQFISATGRRYGLRIDTWVDDRRDPFLATDAAARHLADLKDQFGSWYLAAAAYNAGATRVSRGLERLPGGYTNSDTTFFALSDRRYLRRETRDYVPKLIAATLIAKSPVAYEFDSVTALPPLVFDEITIPDQTGLDVLAMLADTSASALVELNPRFHRGATPPNERVTVRVPRGTGPQVLQRYAELPVDERVNFVEHVIRRGETLSGIASQYRVRLRALEAANPGAQPRRLRVGQRLTIPLSPTVPSSAGRAAPSATPSSPPTGGVHMVRRGETLWTLGRRYGVTVGNLRRWNGIPENVTLLEVGQRLRVAPPVSGGR